jgi:flagellar protein FliS
LTNPYAVYANVEEESLSKEELLLKTYEKILEHLNVAALAIDNGDVKTKAESLTKVTNALTVLQSSLDFENGREIAENLYRIYDFCILELVKANALNDRKKVEDVRDIVKTIYDGFKKAVEGEGNE